MIIAFTWGLAAGSALLIGALVGWYATPGKRTTAAIMAFGSGVLISAVAFDLMDEARLSGGMVPTSLGFLAGALAFTVGTLLLGRLGGRHRKRSGRQQDPSGQAGIAIALGSLLDGIPEAMVIGLSLLEGEGVALATVAAIFLSNLPEGLSSAAGMKATGRGRGYVFGVWGGVTLICGLAALAGFSLFEGADPRLVALTQAIAGGAIIAMIADTMIPEAFGETHSATGLITALGFLVAFSLSHMLG
ncbi:ZIP family zinc transporter [Kaustia mangrovi]|uniref:ZIP family zinc transporter n=1 Tax=Kaustia mangrovi TaxID=2593653 RepID=A0A7S8C7T6_9HYPH|nr:ZIP family zinc transporter [Kaustia mangrovi]QPC44876.1 ZIP family zinc transporter [Kaustia mangrovi]